jgi:hypothetical protein
MADDLAIVQYTVAAFVSIVVDVTNFMLVEQPGALPMISWPLLGPRWSAGPARWGVVVCFHWSDVVSGIEPGVRMVVMEIREIPIPGADDISLGRVLR